ncbi:capsular biosynthesis protein [Streptococcus cristatus]|jgi:capsular polysaccharide biosynthesis protein cps4G|uniref:hypothetical protein n=1 Tax=Streptococcus cristatus TaxID=45634 RepID=UPI00061EDC14|nr:hypothetical protein [Streptococcus cristatus]KJQ57800.1 hypothetical protein TW70_01538 [Streptococcus cristatus]MBZ2152376.1 capsular biosynthesis protein [Streptococcus cristatus]QIP48629.1 glycosyltransferase family 4 protein [Streptococcus cristatus ATCC 51100]
MKKICIITMGNIYLVPYLQTYLSQINHPVSIIYWDRANLNETYKDNDIYRFQHKFATKTDKILGYCRYRKFIKKILLDQEFDVVILLQTLSALLLHDILLKKFKHQFIVDIRDYTYEDNKIIFAIEKKLLSNSAMNIVSSEGFLKFLPKDIDYEIAHNIRKWPNEALERIKNRKKNKSKLHIVFVGYVNYQEQHKKLLLKLKNDSRFEISFIGTRAQELEDFCEENQIENVRLIGTFQSEDTLKFYEDADFVNNLYGNNTPVLDYALSNKLYYAAILNIPILVCENTFMEEISNTYNFGITVDLDLEENLGDFLFLKYSEIDWNNLSNGCESFLKEVNKQQNRFERNLSRLLN